MSIKSIPISKSLIEKSSLVFENPIVKECFKQNMWIAGGFARNIGHLVLGLTNTSLLEKYLLSYLDPNSIKHDNSGVRSLYKNPGDIDFFSSDQNNIFSVSNKYSSFPHPARSVSDVYFSRSVFANNLSYYHKYYHNTPETRESYNIKIQLVRKFCFDSIKSCFDSFDITNSKYAISKFHGNHYVLHYDDEALKYDAMQLLHISHSDTPYLASRIIKYLKNRNLKAVSHDKDTTDRFNDYLFKCVINKWDSLFNVDESFIHTSIKSIDRFRKLSDIELSMFIGKISHNIATSTRSFGSYGVYMITSYKKSDWASHMLSERV